MTAIIELISSLIINLISAMGYSGIVLLMALESACIPIPSEIIMPFSGFLAYEKTFTLLNVALAGTIGCTIGSIFAYFVGSLGGRPLLEKYGRYIFIREKEIKHADEWFVRFGDEAVFISRLLPVIRTFISLPAGIARMNFWKFTAYSFIGSLPWCFALAYLGYIMRENWSGLRLWFERFDILIVLIIIAAVGYWIYRHLRDKDK